MDIIKNYKDLLIDIDVQQCIVWDIESEIKNLQRLAMRGPTDIKGVDYSREPGGSTMSISLDRLLDRLERIQERYEIQKIILTDKKRTRNKILMQMSNVSGIDLRVKFMRDIECKSLNDISIELDFTYQYIKEVSARNKPTYNVLTNAK